LITLLLLAIYRLAANIPVPGLTGYGGSADQSERHARQPD
jgi:preprotein translocase subunit SecY